MSKTALKQDFLSIVFSRALPNIASLAHVIVRYHVFYKLWFVTSVKQ